MSFVLGLLAGLLWGAAGAAVNGLVARACVRKNTSAAMTVNSIVKLAVDLGVIAAVLLLKNYLPFSFNGALIGTVCSISMLSIIISYRIARS